MLGKNLTGNAMILYVSHWPMTSVIFGVVPRRRIVR